MKYARILNNKIYDICPGNPADHYHPDVSVLYDTQVPDDASVGDGWENKQLIKQATEPATKIKIMKMPPLEFMMLFTSSERVAIKSARKTDDVIEDFFNIIEDPRLLHVDLGLESTSSFLNYLVDQSLLTQVRRDHIGSGYMPI